MASKFNQARQERHELKAEALAILEAPAAARTPAETARLNAIEARIAKLDPEIDALARQLDAERTAPTAVSPLPRPAGGARFAEMFPAAPLSMDGWASSGEFLATVMARVADPRLHSVALDAGVSGLRAASVAIPSEGGLAVPSEIAAQWFDASLSGEIIRPRCRVWPMAANTLGIPAWEEGGTTTDEIGGWTAEGSEIAPGTPLMRRVDLTAKKLAILVPVSLELLQDGHGYDRQLEQRMIKGIGRKFDRGFLRGTGAGEPLGILNSPALITVAKENAQTAGTIYYQNLLKMFARMLPGSITRAVWIASPTCIPALGTLSLAIGASGVHIPVLTESGGEFRMLTRPCVFSDLMPSIGNAGDIVFADLSAYNVGVRQGVSLDRSAHVGFTRATEYFRALTRADGMPGLDAPITPDTGDTLSPFIRLAERS